MKAITLHQPWASLIAAGVKTIETRGRRTSYRGRIAIHAGKRLYTAADKHADPALWHRTHDALALERNGGVYDLPYGAVVASAVLTDCVPIVEDCDDLADPVACIESLPGGALRFWADGAVEMHELVHVTNQRPFGDFSPGRYALLLDDIAPTTDRCPWCWGAGGTGNPILICPFCDADGRCDPIPARGQQALPWEWAP